MHLESVIGLAGLLIVVTGWKRHGHTLIKGNSLE